MDNGLALVTGASSGIGLEIARCFAKDGHVLVMIADDTAELERAARELRAGGARRVDTVVADLALPDGARQLYETVSRGHGTPDFLVNNAGRGSTATSPARPSSTPSCA
jgi:NAD(P)-dependent dehydrogenase (short-subunit alcohol dehydrogenase family)